MSGLAPNTTYHFDVVATNADGQPRRATGRSPRCRRSAASIARATTAGPALSLTIACAGGSGLADVRGRSGSPRSRRASEVTRQADPQHPGAKAPTVAGGSYSVPSGKRVTGADQRSIALAGRCSAQHYVLATTMSLRGTTQVTRTVTFRYPRITSTTSYTFGFGSGTSTATQSTVIHIPRGGRR